MSSIYARLLASACLVVGVAYGQTQPAQIASPANSEQALSERSLNVDRDLSPASYQDMLATLRQVAGVVPQLPTGSILVKGNPDQLAMAAWIAEHLSSPADHSSGNWFEPANGDAAEIFPLPDTMTPQSVQEIVTTLRQVEEVHRIFQFSGKVIILSGTRDEVDLAEWLVPRLIEPRDESSPDVRKFEVAGRHWSQVRVFHLKEGMTPQDIQKVVNGIRKTVQVTHLFACFQARALAMWGTEQQIADAERLIEEQSNAKTEKTDSKDQ